MRIPADPAVICLSHAVAAVDVFEQNSVQSRACVQLRAPSHEWRAALWAALQIPKTFKTREFDPTRCCYCHPSMTRSACI